MKVASKLKSAMQYGGPRGGLGPAHAVGKACCMAQPMYAIQKLANSKQNSLIQQRHP
jgi:hypothetical protein